MSGNPYDEDGEGGAYTAAGGAYDDVPDNNAYAEGDPADDMEAGPPQPPPPPGPKPMGLQQGGVPPAPTSDPGYFAKLNIHITYVTVLSSLWIIAAGILNMILSSPVLADVIIDAYLIFFAICFLVIMLPNINMRGFGWLGKLRGSVETWTRFLSTNWGRGWFFIFISVLAFGQNSVWRIITGIVLIINGILSIWCGRLAAAKYNRLREYLVAGTEGDQLLASVNDKGKQGFDVEGNLYEAGIKSLIIASGRQVTTSEVHAIYSFFDREHTGKIDIEQFAERLAQTVRLKSL